MKKLIIITLFLLGAIEIFAQVIPLPNAHSHNDYNRKRPLKSALQHGFTSVEADVLYIFGKLVVGHGMPSKRFPRLKSLKRQYLKPLYRHYKKSKKEIYPGYGGDFYLWIDIKIFPNQAYRELRELLYPMRDMLNYWENGSFHKGKVTVILSGNRPFEALQKDSIQLMTIDGRPEDLDKNYPDHLMLFISENAKKVTGVKKAKQAEVEALQKIKEFVENAHKKGKKTRLWATPEDEQLWQKLIEMKIDLINTDKLGKLKAFLLKRK